MALVPFRDVAKNTIICLSYESLSYEVSKTTGFYNDFGLRLPERRTSLLTSSALSGVIAAALDQLYPGTSVATTITKSFTSAAYSEDIQTVFGGGSIVKKSWKENISLLLRALGIGFTAFSLASFFPVATLPATVLNGFVGSALCDAVKALAGLLYADCGSSNPRQIGIWLPEQFQDASRKDRSQCGGSLPVEMLGKWRFDRAIQCSMRSLETSRKHRDRRSEGASLGLLGLAYHRQGQIEKAIEHYGQALQISHEIGDWQSAAAWLGNLGKVYGHLGRPDSAINFYLPAIIVSRGIGDRRSEMNWLGDLGCVYHSAREVAHAIECYEDALTVGREVPDPHKKGLLLFKLDVAHRGLGQVKQSQQYLGFIKE